MSRRDGVFASLVLGLMVSCTVAWADWEQPYVGTVESVMEEPTSDEGLVQVRVRLEGGAGTAVVQLAPPWYLEQLWVTPEPGDTMEIVGIRVGTGAEVPIVAARIAIGEELIYLREGNGSPLWERLAQVAITE